MVKLTEKRFGLTETGELINNETGRVYCVKGISALDLQDILNRLIKENKELQVQCNLLREQANEFHRGARENANRAGQLEKENKELKKELFEVKEDYILETYADNPSRRDVKLEQLKKELI